MAPQIPTLSPEEIKPRIQGLFHAGRSLAQADLYSLDWEGKPCLLKDFSARPWWIRSIWGRMIIAREYRALCRLYGIEGIPKIYARVGPYGIIMERLDAKRLPRRKEKPPPSEYFDRANALVGKLHDLGIGHGDLRRLNVLMDDQARPYLIDFATAVNSKPGLLGLPSRMLFRRYAVVDRYQMAQMKADFYPMNLTPEEEKSLRHPPGYLKYGRFVKKYVLRWRKSRHRKRYLRSIKRKLRRLTGSRRKEE